VESTIATFEPVGEPYGPLSSASAVLKKRPRTRLRRGKGLHATNSIERRWCVSARAAVRGPSGNGVDLDSISIEAWRTLTSK
jgi:hypothetical protein